MFSDNSPCDFFAKIFILICQSSTEVQWHLKKFALNNCLWLNKHVSKYSTPIPKYFFYNLVGYLKTTCKLLSFLAASI